MIMWENTGFKFEQRPEAEHGAKVTISAAPSLECLRSKKAHRGEHNIFVLDFPKAMGLLTAAYSGSSFTTSHINSVLHIYGAGLCSGSFWMGRKRQSTGA